MELKELEDFVRKASVLLAHFEDSASKITATSIKNVENLERTIRDTDEKVADILNSSALKVKDETNHAVHLALESGVSAFEERLKEAIREIDYDISQLTKERLNAAKQMKFLTWKSITVLAIGLLVLLGSVSKVAWDKKNELAELEARYKRLEYSADVKDALNKLTITSCGGTPCIKLDDKAKRWGKDGEYILTQ